MKNRTVNIDTVNSGCNGDCNQGRTCDCAPERSDDGISAARGIINGLLLSILIWAVIGLAVWVAT